MGLKHLRRIENELKENQDKSYSKTEIRDALNIDYRTVLDSLAYLISEGKIKVEKTGGFERYNYLK